MPAGCCVCNPLCGKCQPAPFKSATCPQCNTINIFKQAQIVAGDKLLCKKCTTDLSEIVRPKVLRCAYSGKLCAYPCSRSVMAHPSAGYLPCERTTKPSKEWFEKHPGALSFAEVNDAKGSRQTLELVDKVGDCSRNESGLMRLSNTRKRAIKHMPRESSVSQNKGRKIGNDLVIY